VTRLSFAKLLGTAFLISHSFSCFAQASLPVASPLQSDPVPLTLDAPLPKQADFLKQVAAKGDRYAELRQNYVCRTSLVIQPKQSSDSKASMSEDYDSFFVNGKEIHRLQAINGRPLSEAAKDEEDVRLQKEISTTIPHKRISATGPQTLEEAVFAADVFTGEQRTVKDGRNYISFHFQGNRQRHPKSILELIAGYLQGDVLIDEKDHAIVQMRGVTQADVIYAHQLFIPGQFPALIYQAKRINDEMYVPSLVTIAVADRQPEGTLATILWKSSLETRTYTVESCKKFRVTSTILPAFKEIP
jgi:hypothetical protein